MNMARTYGLNRSLGGAIAAIALVAVLSSAAVLYTMQRESNATAGMDRANQIIRQLDRFETAMINQETGVRGFLLTGQPENLEPYSAGKTDLVKVRGELDALLGNDPRLGEAEAAAGDWQQNFGDIVAQSAADPTKREQILGLVVGGAGKQRFDRLRDRLHSIDIEQERARADAQMIVAHSARNAVLALLIGSVLVLLICAAMGIAINRLIVRPLIELAIVMGRLAQREFSVTVPGLQRRNEVGGMARAVEVFKSSMIELDRTSVMRVTADTLPALVGYIDTRHCVGFLNSEFERWFELKTDLVAITGQPVASVFSVAPFPGVGAQLETALAGNEVRFEHTMLLHGTEHRDLEAYYRPHRDGDGRVLGAVTLLTDITDRKNLELRLARQAGELLRSNEELESFAYVASHDLKAPLRGIDNLVTWIEEDLGEAVTGDVRTNMDLLRSRVRRLENLLDDLLAYSRAGRGDLTLDMIDTQQLVAELAELVSPPAGFTIEGVAPLPTLRASRAPLTQALQNLMSNAIKHHDNPAAGHVWVEAGRSGAMVEFVVSDNGPGIPPQFRERVFGMFQTLRPRDEVEGSGMGLAIVKKLVERQGGTAWLTDNSRGRGLAVHFTWPNR
ncbi:MAG: CHASE3 domain-containing protein [Alphaproteobacteria bacterium]|nr:CHASE3 domain-containing protein [Alphaproteobacteria bacterium]